LKITVILTYGNLQIKALNEDDQNTEESLKPSAEKTREARAAVREALREQRVKLKELRQGMKEGRDLSEDMDTCLGEIELLQKELQSIDEGGHVTFLEAKDLIAPKKGISAKKSKLREEMDGLKKEVAHLEARLSMPNLTDEERSRMLGSISEKNDEAKGLEEEMEALRNFDHTRFVEAREESKRSMELENALEKIESRKEELTGQMLEALEQANEPLIGELHEKINLIEEERKRLLEPDGDPLLQEESPDK
jgi:DNA repair exonuclease SbcCD ATPase subunit